MTIVKALDSEQFFRALGGIPSGWRLSVAVKGYFVRACSVDDFGLLYGLSGFAQTWRLGIRWQM